MHGAPRVTQLFLACCFFALTACALGNQDSTRLAAYFQSTEGQAKWKNHDAELAQAAQVAEASYRQAHTVEALQTYETSARAYLDHGFLFYNTLYASSIEPPKGIRTSLEDRTLKLLEIADEYLKHGASDIIAVGIAREVIHKYSVGRMDRAQRRAEAILSQYRYQRNY